MKTMLEEQLEDEQCVHTTLMTMCLQHLGQLGATMMATDCQTMINAFRATMGLDTTYVDREPEAQRGHPGHKDWIMKNQYNIEGDNDNDKNDKEEIGDKANNDLEDENDNDEDDAMDGTMKKRKVDK